MVTVVAITRIVAIRWGGSGAVATAAVAAEVRFHDFARVRIITTGGAR